MCAACSVGSDACVVMPTGGGKSLCYQLPAALARGSDRRGGFAADCADAGSGRATHAGWEFQQRCLTARLRRASRLQILARSDRGAYRLLYLSPERLARADTIEWLQRVPVSIFAIDEAHCISEWGHEFRPEYRQMSSLRANFPDRPIAAFTASATRQVRHDIIEQWQLREPHKYIASFHRAESAVYREAMRAGDAIRAAGAGAATVMRAAT